MCAERKSPGPRKIPGAGTIEERKSYRIQPWRRQYGIVPGRQAGSMAGS